jgi:predicted NBD/HSP70 family sugar kinase
VTVTAPTWAPDTGASRSVALEVLLNGPLSRSEIARRLDLSPGSLTRLSAPLIETGLLVETGELAEGRTGRPSRPLDVVPSFRHFIGMKLMADRVQGVATDLRANVIATDLVEFASRDPETVADAIAELARRLSREVPPVTAIGIGLGGRIADNSRVASAAFLEWEDVPLVDMIEQRVGISTVIENDVVAFTEAEHWFGYGRGLDRFAVITLGAGIGYGLVIHDGIVADDDTGIGLIGHWPLDPFGPLCPAGHRGCARSVLTQADLVHEVGTALGREVSYDEALTLAAAGEPAARRVVDDAGRGLGRLLAAVANLTMPERIVLGGEGVRLVDVARAAIDQGIAADRDPRAAQLDLITTSGDNLEWCRGAAVIAIQTYVLGTHPGFAR